MQKRSTIRSCWMIPIISIATMIGLNIILFVLDIAKYSEAYRQAAQTLYAPTLAVRILYSGILMPVLEELIFRGLAFRLMRRKWPFLTAMILSSLLFGIYHGNLVQFIYASLCGCLLAYLYEVYGKIWAPILAHMSMNTTTNIMTEFGMFSWILSDIVKVIIVTGICAVIIMCVTIRMQKMETLP